MWFYCFWLWRYNRAYIGSIHFTLVHALANSQNQPLILAAQLITELNQLDIPFYAKQLDDLARLEEGMAKYLLPIKCVKDPYQRLYKFSIGGKSVCFYQIPKSASTAIFEALLLQCNNELLARLSDLLADEYRNLYYSYLHLASKKFLTKQPVEDIASSSLNFLVRRDEGSRFCSAILNKVVVPFWNNDTLESYILNHLEAKDNSYALAAIGKMTLSQIAISLKSLDDSHFRPADYPSPEMFSSYDISRMGELASDLTKCLGVNISFNVVNTTSIVGHAPADEVGSDLCVADEAALMHTPVALISPTCLSQVRQALRHYLSLPGMNYL